METIDWKTIIAILIGSSALVAAFKIKLTIRLDLNDIVEQILSYRYFSKQLRITRECPHVYPLDVNRFTSRPGFKSAYMINEDDGSFKCSMCGQTGFVKKEMVSAIEAFWSTRTWKYWDEHMTRRLKAEGRSIRSG